jgi:ribosome-associated protein
MNFAQIASEASIVAIRSRGPGGQNVNKVSSAAQLFWNFQESTALTDAEKQLVRIKLKNLINSEDQIFLRADEYRDLERNKSRVIEKLEAFLLGALHKPKPRRKTKPTRASKIRKLEGKSHRGEIKKGRQKVKSWD